MAILTAALICSGCAQIVIKDETLYFDEGPDGAVTVNFLSPGSTQIPEAQWNTMREGDVCMGAASFGDFKSEIEKACSEAHCKYQGQISSFFARLKALVTDWAARRAAQ